MSDAPLMARLQFAFTVTYHYLFAQLTMGLAVFLVLFKALHLVRGDERANQAARFWTRIFAVTFVIGVVTGIPLEFQFGTNWARFSIFAGGIIAQTLAMEGAFAFFLESAFLGLLLYGEQRLGPKLHGLSAVMVLVGTWASGYFILATNAWMQHPVGYRVLRSGAVQLTDYWAVLLNRWAVVEFLHNQSGAVVTGAFTVAGVGAFYLLARQNEEFGRLFVKTGVVVGLLASLLQIFPSGDLEGLQVTRYQPTKLAAMEGLFHAQKRAGIVILGQPNVASQSLDNPLIIPDVLSFLTYRQWTATVKGLDDFPRSTWPDNIPLLYFSYHIMVGLGTLFIALMGLCTLCLPRGRLFETRWLLWLLMLAVPFPFIANTAGWLTAELGRQPWLAQTLLRTSAGTSPTISSGSIWFTLLGFMGMYALVSILFGTLVVKEIAQGPDPEAHARTGAA